MDNQYWQDRSIQRLAYSEQVTDTLLAQHSAVYERALKNIERDIEDVYRNYAENGILSKKEMQKVLSTGEVAVFKRKLRSKAARLGIDPDLIYDERYLSRLTRLQAIKEQTTLEIASITLDNRIDSEQHYSETMRRVYSSTQADLQVFGVSPAFTTMSNETVEKILLADFYGNNYSGRIWGNTERLARELKGILGGGVASGASSEKIGRQIRERFEVSRYNALRLARTETNYFHNQAELQSYIDDGITEYKYSAHLDHRTSKICRKLDESGDIFKSEDAEVGLNYPPMHPHCRSTTTPVIPDDASELQIAGYQDTSRLQQTRSHPTVQEWSQRMQVMRSSPLNIPRM